jgi:hypothetical protein
MNNVFSIFEIEKLSNGSVKQFRAHFWTRAESSGGYLTYALC